MASLYTDHNVALPTATALRIVYGHDIVTARDLGLERADDAVHFLTAAQQGRILITHNAKDFVLLQEAWLLWSVAWGVAPTHAGVLVIPHRWLPPQAAREIDAFLNDHLIHTLTNRLYAWRSGVGWTDVDG